MTDDEIAPAKAPVVEPIRTELKASPALVPVGPPSERTIEAGPVAIGRRKAGPGLRLTVLVAILILAGAAVGEWLLAPTAVSVTKPMRGPAVQAVYATGSVEASVMIPIAGRITARLAQLNADEGDGVTKGQVLARFEDQDLQSALAQAQAQEQFAKKEFDRTAKLLETGAVTKSAYDKAYSDWQTALSATQKASAEAEFLQLVSPADGVIVRRDGEIGQLIPANQTILWLTRNRPLRITSDVDEEDIGLVKLEQEVLIRADAFPGKVFHGRVQSITPMGDPVARSYRVRIELVEDTPLLIGMTTETNIIAAEHKDALLLPATAVAGDKIWRVVDGRLVQQTVSIGIKGADKVEIVGGLTADDEVVVSNDASFTPGKRVRPVVRASQ
jgi:membrane fusion protein, multidrug efflux system